MEAHDSRRVFVGFARLRFVAKVGYVRVVKAGCEGKAKDKDS
jgi:hypothetical protein